MGGWSGWAESVRAWRLIEPCCGSAAVTLALLGAKRPLLPYQGSKWRFRRSIVAVMARLGFTGTPARFRVQDVGPWGRVVPTVLRRREEVLAHLRGFVARDAREVFDQLQHCPVSEDDARYAAEFLFLQRLSYSGKAVGDRGGRWHSPGFNTSSAYGVRPTSRFGRVRPMLPSLIRVLESYAGLRPVPVDGERAPARPPDAPVEEPTLVYLDPPYRGSTRYPMGDLDRAALVRLALAWREAGATVLVSESEAVEELVQAGWCASRIDPGRQDRSPFRGKQQEWLTWSGEGSPG